MVRGRTYRIAAVVAGLLVLLGWAAPAQAAPGDRISRFGIDYTIRPNGTIDVVETIDYQFASSGRHGIYRDLLTRAPFGDGSARDVIYTIQDVRVDSDAPDDVDRSTHREGYRFAWTRLQIGDPDRTVNGRQATYRISYSLDGALRTVNGIPELYWNATGNDWDAAIDQVAITVNTPGGVESVSCYQGLVGSTQTCSATESGDVASASASGLDVGEGVTISVQVPAGTVSDAQPEVVQAGSFVNQARLGPATIGGSALAVLLAGLAGLWMSRVNRDRRYAGVPPGVIDTNAPVVIDDIDEDTIPVQFNPPPLPAGAAGALVSSGSSTQRAAAATLIELANAGVLTISATEKGGSKYHKSGGVKRIATVGDLDAGPQDYRATFARSLLGSDGAIVLDQPKKRDREHFQKAVAELNKSIGQQLKSWRRKGGAGWSLWLTVLAIVALIVGTTVLIAKTAPAGLIYLVPAILVFILLVYVLARRSIGYRTAEGRALADQVVGFRRYIETAEAGKLKFEEGRDIFSDFLPWAIVFGLADRWQKVCAELAREGRIPDHPVWYNGPAFYVTFSNGSSFGDSLNTATVSNSTTGGGSSGSSGSGGGGFSGGGGGGGGGGSW